MNAQARFDAAAEALKQATLAYAAKGGAPTHDSDLFNAMVDAQSEFWHAAQALAAE